MSWTRALVLLGLGWFYCLTMDPIGSVVRAANNDLAQLLTDVRQIPVIGTPGSIIPFGPQAFPLVVGNTGETKIAPVVAAARLGKGRIVVFGHGGYLNEALIGDLNRLVLNSVHWASDERKAKGLELRVTVCGQNNLAKFLRTNQIATIGGEPDAWQPLLNQCDVFCVDTDFHDNPDLADAVLRFVLAGW